MDSDSDEEKHYASADMEDDEEPCSPSQQSASSQPPNPDFLQADLKIRMMLVIWQVNSHNPQ